TLSDPRAVELKRLAGELAKEKGREDEYNFLKLIEQEGIKCLQEHREAASQRVQILISTVALSMK
ncbi:citrate (Si)-synthase, partial [human gut metagenome]